MTRHQVPCGGLAPHHTWWSREPPRRLILRVSALLECSAAASPVPHARAGAPGCLDVWRDIAGGTRARGTHSCGPCRPCPHLQAGVVAIRRQRELRAAVVSQLVHQQIVLALVAPRAGSRGRQRRATPPGREPGALAHGTVSGRPAPCSRSWEPGEKGPRLAPNWPRAKRCPGGEDEGRDADAWLAGLCQWLPCLPGWQ